MSSKRVVRPDPDPTPTAANVAGEAVIESASASRTRRRWVLRASLYGLVLGVCVVLIASAGSWLVAGAESLALRALTAGRPADAVAWLDRAERVVTTTPSLQLLRARAERRLGRLNAVRSALDQAARLGANPKDIHLENCLAQAQSGQLGAVERFLPQFLAEAGDRAPEICEAYVVGYLRSQRFDSALQLLGAWIADWPGDSRPLLFRSRVWMVEQQTKQALEDLSKALELTPQDLEITYELATVLRQRNEWDRALEMYSRCWSSPLWGGKSKLGSGLCHKALGHAAESERFLREAAAPPAADTEALREYGRWLQENGRSDEAIAVLERAVGQTPYDDELHYLLAQALQGSGKQDAARPHFDYVAKARTAFRELRLIQDQLRKTPTDTALLARAGEILMRYSDPEEGVVRLMAVLDREPHNTTALSLLVEHYERRSAHDPAYQPLAEEFRRRLTEAPPVPPRVAPVP
jgi:tetratricopeptide (TPR) repeat protein